MTLHSPIRCWEPTLEDHALLVTAQNLYERTLDADERIPWQWIERSVVDREPGTNGWRKHLHFASINGELAGLAYGAFLPGFGGYLCYVTVDERFRGHGVATRLYEVFFQAMRNDARACKLPLPFVLWESCRPEPEDDEAAQRIWKARERLFRRVGGGCLDGVALMTPNYLNPDGEPVPLQVFLKPMDETEFDGARLREIVSELLARVYGEEPGDTLYEATLGPGVFPYFDAPVESKLAGTGIN